ncbi:hypothetical protein EKO27_g6581 [Xylaria grammica]|uniref:Uncharacterized protein n=1 Tax=Xylaria grammica TaxID=363999 RepID=A0A439D245_9PEZI|nr:hypothetical protein EKO27_g6581 [Xylaria grammica]
MAPSTPRAPTARDNPGARGGLPSNYKRNAIASISSNTSSGRGCRKSGSRPSPQLATRETTRELIVIDSDSDYDYYSDDDDDDDDDDAVGSSGEPAAASPLLVPSASPSSKAIPVEGRPGRTSTTDSCTPQRRFSGFWDLLNTPTKKTMNPTPRQSPLPVKDEDITPRRLPDTRSTLAPLNGLGSRDSTQTSKPVPNGETNGVKGGKTGINVGVPRREPPAAAPTTAVTTARAGVLPPMFPPAVKARVYAAPKPAARRNISSGSKKLEAFGFVSAASLIAGTATTATRNVGTITPAPMPKSSPIPQPIAKPIKQEISRPTNIVQVQNRTFWSSPRTTHDTSTAAAIMPIVEQKAGSESKHLEATKIRTSNTRSLPRTPENTITTKRAVTPSSSIGTYGDPYAISSDSDSDDDDDDDNGELHDIPSVKSLNSFAENTNAHETASDVEAVLNQLPAFFDSPSPTEHRSSYLAISGTTRPAVNARPIITARSSKRVRDNEIKDSVETEEGKKKRRVRFGEYDESGSSTIPVKRVDSTAKRLTSPPPTGSPSPASYITASSRLASPIERTGGLGRRNTAFGADSNSNRCISSNLYHNPGQGQNRDQDRDGPVMYENKASLKEKSEKKKRRRRKSGRRKTKKKRKTKRNALSSMHNKAASRHRNRDRAAWRKAKGTRSQGMAHHG